MPDCWQLEAVCPTTGARAGWLTTCDGTRLPTPLFQPVATSATVKTLNWDDVSALGYRHVLMNTYHLVVGPGLDLIERCGGIKQFSAWQGSVLTDSGGYQVHSLSAKRSLKPDGVHFTDHLHGGKWHFSPEFTLTAQLRLSVDFAMPIDVCTSLPAERKAAAKDLALTHSWAAEQVQIWPELTEKFVKDKSLAVPRLFGIVQGGLEEDLRQESAEFIGSLPFDGCAIGGLSVGESREDFKQLTAFTTPLLPEQKVRYLMGVGDPADMLFAIASGIDIFDCVQPARMARHGTVYTGDGTLNLKNSRFADDTRPPEPDADWPGATTHSRAYLRHLVMQKEHSYARILSMHNLGFYGWLMSEARKRIIDGSFMDWHKEMIKNCDRKLPDGL